MEHFHSPALRGSSTGTFESTRTNTGVTLWMRRYRCACGQDCLAVTVVTVEDEQGRPVIAHTHDFEMGE